MYSYKFDFVTKSANMSASDRSMNSRYWTITQRLKQERIINLLKSKWTL